jgi:hypothetical protein
VGKHGDRCCRGPQNQLGLQTPGTPKAARSHFVQSLQLPPTPTPPPEFAFNILPAVVHSVNKRRDLARAWKQERGFGGDLGRIWGGLRVWGPPRPRLQGRWFKHSRDHSSAKTWATETNPALYWKPCAHHLEPKYT